MTAPQHTVWKHPRAFPRYLMDQRLLLRAGMVFHGRTKDISEGGLGATIARQLPRHEPIEVEFRLPGSSVTIKAMAEVRYNQGFQYGLRFLYMTDAQRAQIREAVSQLQSAP